jgi:hypothetical protein
MAFSSEVPAMPIGRPCSICSLPFDIRKSLDEKLRLGQSTTSVHRWLSEVHKVSIPLRSVYNHNTAHVKLISRAAMKLSDAQRERKEQLATARAVLHDPDWDAQAYLLPAASAGIFLRRPDGLIWRPRMRSRPGSMRLWPSSRRSFCAALSCAENWAAQSAMRPRSRSR